MGSSGIRTARLVVENATERPRTIWVEPWGEDYTLLPGEKLDLVCREVSEASFHLVEEGKTSLVYVEGRSGGFDVFQEGCRIECGHRRREAEDAGVF